MITVISPETLGSAVNITIFTVVQMISLYNYLKTVIIHGFLIQVDWTPELHKKFVKAVEQLGIDQAIPSRILEIMKVEGLTRHNVASHLQVLILLLAIVLISKLQDKMTVLFSKSFW